MTNGEIDDILDTPMTEADWRGMVRDRDIRIHKLENDLFDLKAAWFAEVRELKSEIATLRAAKAAAEAAVGVRRDG